MNVINKKELEERLINFSVFVIAIVQAMPESKVASHLSGQLIRSGTSSALNYGEAQSGESRKDFIHKLKIVVKELRESNICLRVISRTMMINTEKVQLAINESSELIGIFVKSIETAQKNLMPDSVAANSKK